MLIEQTLEKLTAMQLHGMVSALRQWQAHPPAQPLTPADLIGLLADAEWVYRENRKLTARLKAAKLKLPACVEDIDYRHPRGLTKTLLVDLGTARWVAAHQTVILTGATGLGKGYRACAPGHWGRDRRRRHLRSARPRGAPDQAHRGVAPERLDERDEASEVERPSVATLRGVRLDRYGCSASPGIGDRLRPEWAFDSAGIRTPASPCPHHSPRRLARPSPCRSGSLPFHQGAIQRRSTDVV